MSCVTVNDLKKQIDSTGLVTSHGLAKKELFLLLRAVKQYKINSELCDHKTFKFANSTISLNEQQEDIVKAPLRANCRVIACAGSGKTTTIVCRIKYLIDKGINPLRILLTTFNVDAAESMRNKINELFGFVPKIYMGTIDSIAYRFYTMYFKRDDFVGVSEYCTEFLAYLKSPDGLKIKEKFDYVFFDEFQDCNETQFNIIKELHNHGCSVTVIGDDAQNIYQWRGSNIDFILNFDKHVKNSRTFTLSKNFRSTPEIIAFSNKSISLNNDQIPKEMIPHRQSINIKPSIRKYMNEDEQSEAVLGFIASYQSIGIPFEEIVIISRNNYSLKNVEEAIEKYNCRNSKDRYINYVALISDDKRDSKPKIMKNHLTLTTIHKSKGLEWDVVFFLSCNDDKFPANIDKVSIQEERRLFYVAITRAKRYLNISFTGNHVSRFIGELDNSLYDFPSFKQEYFQYTNTRTLNFKNGVTSLVEMLEPHDIKNMRELGLIPEIKPCTQSVHRKHSYSPYIQQYYLQADYGIYIDRYISRQFGVMNPLSCGLVDLTASKVLYSLSLSRDYYTLYMQYNANIISKLDRVKTKTINTIMKKLDKRKKDQNKHFIKKIASVDYEKLKTLVTQILEFSDNLSIEPSELFIVPVSYTPYNFHNEIIVSYKRFKNRKLFDINEDIYKVSLCGMIYEGRRRLLYKNVFEHFNTDIDLYSDIDNWINNFKHNTVIVKKGVIDTRLSICGEIDMYDKSSASIIDFKTSLSSECKLEWIIQLLMYASLMKKIHKVDINTLGIYNPLMGTYTDINIGTYDKHRELLKYMDDIRTTRMSRVSNNTIVKN